MSIQEFGLRIGWFGWRNPKGPPPLVLDLHNMAVINGHRSLKLGGRLVRSSECLQGAGGDVVGSRIAGGQFDGPLEMHECLRILLPPVQRVGQVVAGERIIVGDRQRVTKQSHAVMPLGHLHETQGRVHRDHCRRTDGQPALGQRCCRHNRPDEADDRNVKSDRREIREAVGHLLVAALHDPDRRHQGPQKPEPANQQEGASPRLRDREQRHSGQKEGSQPDPRDAELRTRMRIHHSQADGNDGFRDVERVRQHGVQAPRRQGITGERLDHSVALLAPDGNEAKHGAGRKEGHFLQDKQTDSSQLIPKPAGSGR